MAITKESKRALKAKIEALKVKKKIINNRLAIVEKEKARLDAVMLSINKEITEIKKDHDA